MKCFHIIMQCFYMGQTVAIYSMDFAGNYNVMAFIFPSVLALLRIGAPAEIYLDYLGEGCYT